MLSSGELAADGAGASYMSLPMPFVILAYGSRSSIRYDTALSYSLVEEGTSRRRNKQTKHKDCDINPRVNRNARISVTSNSVLLLYSICICFLQMVTPLVLSPKHLIERILKLLPFRSIVYEGHSINNRTVLIFFKAAIIQKRLVLKI